MKRMFFIGLQKAHFFFERFVQVLELSRIRPGKVLGNPDLAVRGTPG
jgi:hypothetical protein